MLIVVPSMVAMQRDVGRMITAYRRMMRAGLSHRNLGGDLGRAAWPVIGASAAMAVLFALTMGRTFVTGSFGAGGMGAAFGVFALGAALITLVAFGLGALAHTRSARD